MKKILSLMAIATTLVFTSCSDDEPTGKDLEGNNNVSIVFETSFKEQVLDLGKEYAVTGGKLRVDAFRFIAGNFVLVDENDKEFVYPKEKSFFIITKGGDVKGVDMPEKLSLELVDVPAGKYKAVKFGVGVDEDTYKNGDQFANRLWERAEKNGLTWQWTTGYRFLVIEGLLNPGADQKQVKYHVAAAANDGEYKKGAELYKEFTIDLTNEPFLVAADKSPQLHLLVDAGIAVGDTDVSKVNDLHGPFAAPISKNSEKMFSYQHTHYNNGKH